MKTLVTIITLFTFGLAGWAQEPAVSPDTVKNEGSTVEKKIDTTVIDIPGFKIVIRESDDDDVEVRVENKKDGGVVYEERVEGDEDDDSFDFDFDSEDFMGKKEKELKNVKTRFVLLELGLNGYINDGTLSTPTGYQNLELQYSKSINVNLHLFRQRVNLIRHHVNLMYGLGFEFNDYRFANDVTLVEEQPELTFDPLDEPLKKSKLAATYLNLPLMVNFETNPADKKQSFRLSAGGFAGVLLGARTKYKTEANRKVKVRDDYNLNNFRYGLTGGIGYGWFNLYANYALSDMFAENQGPVVQPFNVGLVIIGF